MFILNLTSGFTGLGKDNYKASRETFKFWNSVSVLAEVWRYMQNVGNFYNPSLTFPDDWTPLLRHRNTTPQAASKHKANSHLKPPKSSTPLETAST